MLPLTQYPGGLSLPSGWIITYYSVPRGIITLQLGWLVNSHVVVPWGIITSLLGWIITPYSVPRGIMTPQLGWFLTNHIVPRGLPNPKSDGLSPHVHYHGGSSPSEDRIYLSLSVTNSLVKIKLLVSILRFMGYEQQKVLYMNYLWR